MPSVGWLHEQGVGSRTLRVSARKSWRNEYSRFTMQRRFRKIVTHPAPRTFVECRIHAVASTILDTGCRINELLAVGSAISTSTTCCSPYNGKGRKERKVPMSVELRKVLFRFEKIKERAACGRSLMFPARDGNKWEHRNARRSYYCFLKSLALPQSGFHLLRHTFATQYLLERRGCRSAVNHPRAL